MVTLFFFVCMAWQGLGLLTLSAMLPLSLTNGLQLQVMLFFVSLNLMAIGQGGHKPCVQAFGADQFDQQHPKENKDRKALSLFGGILPCVQQV